MSPSSLLSSFFLAIVTSVVTSYDGQCPTFPCLCTFFLHMHGYQKLGNQFNGLHTGRQFVCSGLPTKFGFDRVSRGSLGHTAE